jgi:hypothetical protein
MFLVPLGPAAPLGTTKLAMKKKIYGGKRRIRRKEDSERNQQRVAR